MKKKLIGFIPYLIIFTIDFYLLPLFIKDTGSGMLILLLIIPLIAFLCSLVYGIRRGFSLLLTLAAMILFTPTVFIFYNKTALIYIIGYGIITLIGNAIGKIFYKKNSTI